MIRLEVRKEISTSMVYLAPVLAVVLMLLTALLLFTILDRDPFLSLHTFFIAPLNGVRGLTELAVKATPLVIIALGLSFGFRAHIWNIGAEGQFVVGALAGSAVALLLYQVETVWLLPAMMLAGMIGGMAWAAIPAFLRVRYNANEILTSLMLTYVAIQLLGYLVNGAMKDPDGFNFPESRLFHDSAVLPVLLAGTRLHMGSVFAVLIVGLAWLVLGRHILGFQFRVIGFAPKASSFAGFRNNSLMWLSFLVAGAAAGLAGISEVAGSLQQVVPSVSTGYGFTAIIVAFLGRLHPLGILLAGLLLALTYLGGDLAQIELHLPHAVTHVFQGMLLLFLLGCDVLISYRIRFGSRQSIMQQQGQ